MHFSVVPGVGEGLIPSGSHRSHQHSSQVLRLYLFSPFVFKPCVSLPLAFLECLEEKGLSFSLSSGEALQCLNTQVCLVPLGDASVHRGL